MRAAPLCVLLLSLACGDDDVESTDAGGDTASRCAQECDDGLYCNGIERCDPNDRLADSSGCVNGMPPCPGSCDEATESCSECIDADGDGATDSQCGGLDCDDSNPRIFSGATEVCDAANLDEDCNATTLGDDSDSDGYYSDQCCNGSTCGNDCDDRSGEVNPEAEEICDGNDNDCDGMVDEGVQLTFYRDIDGDNFGDATMIRLACDRPEGHVFVDGDCDDMNQHAQRSSDPERCDGFDNDCDGEADEGLLRQCYVDIDRDTFAAMGAAASTECGACPPGTTDREPTGDDIDCDDADELENPNRVEVCDGANRDEDCDGTPNPPSLCSCPPGDIQSCADVFMLRGVCATGTVSCIAGQWGSCTIEPAATETCGGGDQNCNGVDDADEAVDRVMLYVDMDGDGAGNPSMPVLACAATGLVANANDCDDSNPARRPGADELCNGEDDDCDGNPDENAGITQYIDMDGDGYGTGDIVRNCLMLPGHVNRLGDCDDMNAAVHEDAAEICDMVDNDCDGMTDDVDPDADTWCDGRPHVEPRSDACRGAEPSCSNSCVQSGGTEWWGDCDHDYLNGCELQLITDTTCGQCDATCDLLDSACATHESGSPSCDYCGGPSMNRFNCDPDVLGCETAVNTTANCGDCDHECAEEGSECVPDSSTWRCTTPEQMHHCGNGFDDDFDGFIDESCP